MVKSWRVGRVIDGVPQAEQREGSPVEGTGRRQGWLGSGRREGVRRRLPQPLALQRGRGVGAKSAVLMATGTDLQTQPQAPAKKS